MYVGLRPIRRILRYRVTIVRVVDVSLSQYCKLLCGNHRQAANIGRLWPDYSGRAVWLTLGRLSSRVSNTYRHARSAAKTLPGCLSAQYPQLVLSLSHLSRSSSYGVPISPVCMMIV